MCEPLSLSKESLRFKEQPFTFKLSQQKVAARKKHPGKKPPAVQCTFCGSVKLLGDVNKRSYQKSGRSFCDQECSNNWKSIHYASPNHRPFEESRQRTKAKREAEALERKKREKEKEVARMLRPANAKTPGYYTCVVCKKTEWVEQHSQKQYCSNKCRRKSIKAKQWKKNRKHRIRSKALSQTICLDALMKKHRNRCKHCKTICVKPEGYNHPNEATMDHIMPLSKGGLHLWVNVQLLCRQCNTAKRDKVLPGTQMMLRFEQ